MIVDKIIADREFGHLYIRTNVRAVRYTFRPAKDGTAEGGVLVTAPSHYNLRDLLVTVERMRVQIRALLERHRTTSDAAGAGGASQPQNVLHIDWNFQIESDCLKLYIIKGTREGYYVHGVPAETDAEGQVVKPALVEIQCPSDCDFDADGRQEWFEKAIVEQIRKHAKHQLVPRMRAYAAKYGIQLQEVKINQSKGHWGSCSRHRKREGLFRSKVEYFNINLSLFTLLLPLPVQKLVLLHELNHTRHMDHSPAFHSDLDVWLEGQEQALEKQLKPYTTSIYSFAHSHNFPKEDHSVG